MASSVVATPQPLKSVDEFDDWKRDSVVSSPSLATSASTPGPASTSSSSSPALETEFNPIDPNKKKEEFRNYKDSKRQMRVQTFYEVQHTNMTYDFVQKMEANYCPLNHFQMGIWEALEYLDQIVDDSDPDTNLTQIQHALQTAESCRKKYPSEEHDWFHLTGLIHDLGKILAVKDDKLGLPGEPQWAVVGDTFPVGLPFSPKNVMFDSFKFNPDTKDARFQSALGVYSQNCGLSNVHMSWGHDEYMYRVVVGNGSTLPLSALYMLRYHSFYPWHREGAYTDLLNDQDRQMLFWVKEFNECDLYSKSDTPPSVEQLAPYYKGLIAKYFPAVLKW